MPSLFGAIEMAPRDPILGLNEQFQADPNPTKVNLGVGVYGDETGKLPLLACVAQAKTQLLAASKAHGYLPIDGFAAYNLAVQKLVFGNNSQALQTKRVASVQTLGGTGGLKVGADFLKRLQPTSPVLISDPSWENHRAIFQAAGFTVAPYPYYDASKKGVDLVGMLGTLNAAEPGTVVVLHACCHNPTGYDLSAEEWTQVIAAIKARGLVAFLDMAYQGFGQGIVEDGAVIDRFVKADLNFLVATSFSKSFSLYGERVGALSVVCNSQEEAARVLSQLKVTVRTNYSNPPTYGAQIVATVLDNTDLRQLWEQELAAMRLRIKTMRQALQNKLTALGVQQDLSFITRQQGMFSYSGLSVTQVQRLRQEFGIYAVDSGRICVAALNEGNIDAVAGAIAAVQGVR
jgi:aromatic-amino-acid transaminase